MKKKTINCRLLIQLCCLLCFGPLTTQSGVNLKNGNFYITYTDHDLKGRNGISIDRTYNSKTTSIGLFGFGWGSEFETRLFTVGDGSIYIREYGGGGVTGFVQTETNELLLTSCINSIVAAAIEKAILPTTRLLSTTIKNKCVKVKNAAATVGKNMLQPDW